MFRLIKPSEDMIWYIDPKRQYTVAMSTYILIKYVFAKTMAL